MSSSKAKKHLTQEERTRVASSMCHDVATADRFYCPVPNVTELFQVRGLRMKALMEEADTREEEDSSSVEEGEPSYDDSYDTETPPTPRSHTAQEEDLNSGTPPTPAAQRDAPCDEDLNTGTPPTPAAQPDSPCDEDLNSGTPPTPAEQRDSSGDGDMALELEESYSDEPEGGHSLTRRAVRKLSFSGAVVEKSGVITGPVPPAKKIKGARNMVVVLKDRV